MNRQCKILKPFPYSEDGFTTKQAGKDEVVGIPADLVNGLKDAGYVLPVDEEKAVVASPENKMIAGASENKADGTSPAAATGDGKPGAETDETRDAVEIPENWRDMEFNARKSLAARVSSTPVGPKKEDVHGAIEAAILRRAEKANAPVNG